MFSDGALYVWALEGYRQGQICFLMHLYGIFFKVDFLNAVEAKVIILS